MGRMEAPPLLPSLPFMKFGFRVPSLKKRFAARISPKRFLRHSMGLKVPRGMGMLTNPKKALYHKVYRQTTFGIEDMGRGGAKHKSNSALAASAANITAPRSNGSKRKFVWTTVIGTVLLIALGWGVLFLPFFYIGVAVFWRRTPEYRRKKAIKMSDTLFAKDHKQESIDVLLPFAGEQDFEVFKRLGYRYSLLGKYSEAEPYQSYCHKQQPADIDNVYAYSVTLFNLHKYEESLRVLSSLSDAVQTEAMFANIVGGNYHGMGKDDVAIGIYKKCIGRKQNIEGEEISVAINLVKILIAKKDKGEARKYLLKVLAVSPTHAQGTELLNEC